METGFRALLPFLFVTALGSMAHAQMSHSVTDEIFTGRPFKFAGSYGFDFYPSSSLDGQTAELGIQIHEARIGTPILRTERGKFSAGVGYKLFHTEMGKNAGAPPIVFSSNLHDVQFGLGYLYSYVGGNRFGLDLSFGSASDDPFRSYDEMVINSNAVLAVPSGRNEWLFVLNFSTNRSFLNYIPLPGIVFRYKASERVTALFGVPVLGVVASPIDKLLLNVFILAPVRAKAEVTYFFLGPIRAFARMNWSQERFFRSNRLEKRDLLFYDDVKADAGIASPIGKGFSLEIATGYAFFRSIFEGRSYFRRSTDTYDLDGSFHLRAGLTYRFGKAGRPSVEPDGAKH